MLSYVLADSVKWKKSLIVLLDIFFFTKSTLTANTLKKKKALIDRESETKVQLI